VLCLRQTQALLLCSSTAIFTEGHNCRHLTRNYLHHCLSVAAGCWRLAAGGWRLVAGGWELTTGSWWLGAGLEAEAGG